MDEEYSTSKYIQTWFYMIAMILLIAGAVNWLLIGTIKVNIVEKILGASAARIVYTLVGISALFMIFRRDFYLPFLGESHTPCMTLKDYTPPGATEEVKVYVNPGAKVIYWGSEPATKKMEGINDWRKAYMGFQNAGVTTADINGIATLRLRAPQPYTVPFKTKLESHVHYRECGPVGMLQSVKTVFLNKNAVEGFTNDINASVSSCSTCNL